MKITSPEFEDNGNLPREFTCDGLGVSPILNISEVPAEAKSLVLICDDPDAPRGLWTHWIVWDIPPTVTQIPAGNAAGGTEGVNSWPMRGYGAPCPPSGEHRYYFRLYALNSLLELPETADRGQLDQAMQGKVIAQAELMGRYRR